MNRLRFQHWRLTAAIALYVIWSVMLIARKPGLLDDEALIAAGAVHMQHSTGPFEIEETPDSWVCPFHHCVPLMTGYYIGSVKEYLAYPIFKVLGARTPVLRMVSVILGAIGLWGFWLLTQEFLGSTAASFAAIALAINPSYVNMTIFDYAAVGALMAGFGLTCAGLVFYIRRRSFGSAFALGAAMGFGIWARANFLWVILAGLIAVALVFRKRAVPPAAHVGAIMLGGVTGGLPFLIFEAISNLSTLKVQGTFDAGASVMSLMGHRLFWFADTLISDGEHRRMWAGPPAAAWQIWLFPAIVVVACLICLVFGRRVEERRRRFAQAMAVGFIATAVSLFFSKLEIAEHHLIVLLPIAVVMVIAACMNLQAAFARGRIVSAVVATIYLGSVLSAQAASVGGLRATGGVGGWSDAGIEVAKYLDQDLRGRDVSLVDWGFEYNLYVLTSGRVKGVEIYSTQSDTRTVDGRPWADAIRAGGIFIVNGPENRQFPKPSEAFQQALAGARPRMKTKRFLQRNGATYALLFDIEPNSFRGPAAHGEEAGTRISMADAAAADRLTGFYQIEPGGFRWAGRTFSARLNVPEQDWGGGELSVDLYIPDVSIQELGPITLRAQVGNHALPAERWTKPGRYTYRGAIQPDWIHGGTFTVGFALDKAIPPSSQDGRELGVIVREISIETN